MIDRILEGYRKFAGPGQHLSAIYRRTLRAVFGCVVETDAHGRKYFVHPAGRAFPTFGQFAYRVGQAFPLEVRQVYKYGHTRVRTRLRHSLGRFAESVGNLMERTEQDAYCCGQVAKGFLQGSHQPTLWVVRTRCMASGMIVGIGFSVGAEAASAYRLAKFCEGIDKVKFCSLFGLPIKEGDWPSVGVSPHVIHDRGPGATARAESADPILRPVIKESAPSYAGQSKASIETTHPKPVKLEGKPHYVETRLSIAQLAAQEVMRTIADNHSIDVTDRLNNDAVEAGVFPTPVAVWNYLDRRGRNHAVSMRFEEAVRAYLTPIELTVRDDAVYFKEMRFDSAALQRSGALQKAHACGIYRLGGYHRHHPWRLHDGLFIPHSYTEPCALSWWDDVGFILNGYRVMVWWQHPRSKYSDEIARRAQQQAGAMPDEPLFCDEERLWKRVGRSRKQVVAHRTQWCSEVLRTYFDNVTAIEQRLLIEGIDHAVCASTTMRRYRWGMGMELCAPLEVRGVDGVRLLASLARRLAKREVTIQEAFPGYLYDRDMWLNEAPEGDRSVSLPIK